MKISNVIAEFLNNLIEEADGEVEIRRNFLASQFHCVPSQINYVISTRFTEELGFIVESKRGGGGYIKISKIHFKDNNYLMHIVSSIGNEIDLQTLSALVRNFLDYKEVSEREASIILAALSDNVLSDADRVRILKKMIINLV